MKSLKRTLCLVLALVMVLGLFGIASATDFTDDDAIQYKEAVEVITGIGAINGMGDGTFNPKGTITRAQAATMVACVALTAGVVKGLGGTESSFTDVTYDGGFSWAIPSIEYLTGKGIINGRGDGTFDPNGEISGYAVLKMLLCVLGYGKNSEYVGDGWDLQVAIDANKASLTDGRTSTAALSTPATREEVALYCFNALGARMVTYNKLTDKYDRDEENSAYKGGTKDGTTLADSVYKFQKVVEGVVTKNGSIDALAAKAGTTTIQTANAAGTATVYSVNTGLDLVGHHVRIYYRAATPAEADAVRKASTETLNGVAYAVVDLSTVIEVPTAIATEKELKATFGSTAPTEIAGNGYTIPADRNVTNITTVGTSKANAIVGSSKKIDYSGNAAAAGTYILYKGIVTSFIEPTTFNTDVVTAVTAAKNGNPGGITFKTDTNVIKIPALDATNKTPLYGASGSENKPTNVYEGIAKGDVVIITKAGDFVNVAKAESFKGTVTAYNAAVPTKSPANIVVDGKAYPKTDVTSISTNYLSTTELSGAEDFDATLINKEHVIYLGPDGSVVAITPVEGGASNLVYVVETYKTQVTDSYGRVTEVYKALCVDLNGAEQHYVIGTTDDQTANGNLAVVKTQFDEALQTEKATLIKLVDGNALADGTTTDNTVRYASANTAVEANSATISAGNYYNADTVFLFVKGNLGRLSVTALKGPQKIASGQNYIYYAKAADAAAPTNKDVKVVVVKDTPAVAATSGIMFVPAAFGTANEVSYKNAQGKDSTAYRNVAFVDGVLNTNILTVGEGTKAVGVGFYTFGVDAQGIYSLTPYTGKWGVAPVKNFYNGLLTTDNETATVKGGTALADANASGAFVVDVAYATGAATTGKNSLAEIAAATNKYIYYTFTEEGGKQTVTGVYHPGAAVTEVDLTDLSAVKDAGNKFTATTVVPTKPLEGSTAKLTVTPVKNESADGSKTIIIKSDGVEVGRVTFTEAEQKAATPVGKDVNIVVNGALTLEVAP